MKRQIEMTYKKSTKGTHVYEDKSEHAVIPSVYIRKHGLSNTPPDVIILVIVTPDED